MNDDEGLSEEELLLCINYNLNETIKDYFKNKINISYKNMHLIMFGVLGLFITLYVLRFFSYSYEIYIWKNTRIDPYIYNFKKRTLLKSLLIFFEILTFLFILVYANITDISKVNKTLICSIKLYVNYSKIIYEVLIKIFLILFI